MINVQFLPSKKNIQVPVGSTILEAAIAAGEVLNSTCGGRGSCGKCKVKLLSLTKNQLSDSGGRVLDSVAAAAAAEEWVLACQYTLAADAIVELVQEQGKYEGKIESAPIDNHNFLEPTINKYFITVDRPDNVKPTSYWELLKAALPVAYISFKRPVAISLAQILRQNIYQITVVMEGKDVLTVEPGDTRKRNFGVAIDMGTTTLVAHLVDLYKGLVVSSVADTNPQQIFGADVISRITYCHNNQKGLEQLHTKLISGLNEIINKVCQKGNVAPEEIYQGVVVGNTTMSHLFLGIDPANLAKVPFTPTFRQMVEIDANEVGLNILSSGKVVVLPNVAGFVGSDTVGVMVAAEVDRLKGVSLIIDIGTNGEIILAGEKRIITCSTAAGPAFEGAEIKWGMRASQGAIEGVRIADDVELAIISSEKARGICGSGLIDAVAEMLRVGIIQPSGRLVGKNDCPGNLSPLIYQRLRENQGVREFVLAWSSETEIGEDIVLTQKDIRELQLAKGAILAGSMLLLREMAIDLERIDRILLAGAFGNYIKKESALQIGLFPPIAKEKIFAIGNGAAQGAKMALISRKERERAVSLAEQAEHIELSSRGEFQREFLRSLSFDNVSKVGEKELII